MTNTQYAIFNGFELVEVIKKTAKTSKVVNLMSFDKDTQRVKNSLLVDYTPLTLSDENASTAKLIINKNNPEWGVKRFNYNSEEEGIHTKGTGCNSSLMFANDFKHWLVLA